MLNETLEGLAPAIVDGLENRQKTSKSAREAEMESSNSNLIADGKAVRLPVLPGLLALGKKNTMVEYGRFAESTQGEMRQVYTLKALVLQ